MDLHHLSESMLDAWTRRDWDMIRDHLHPDYVYTGPDGHSVSGIERGLEAGWTSFADAFPDGRFKVNSVVVEGNRVVTEFHFQATHTGEFEGIAPTGRKIEFDVCNLMQLRDGKVVNERDYIDMQGVMAQLGSA